MISEAELSVESSKRKLESSCFTKSALHSTACKEKLSSKATKANREEAYRVEAGKHKVTGKQDAQHRKNPPSTRFQPKLRNKPQICFLKVNRFFAGRASNFDLNSNRKEEKQRTPLFATVVDLNSIQH